MSSPLPSSQTFGDGIIIRVWSEGWCKGNGRVQIGCNPILTTSSPLPSSQTSGDQRAHCSWTQATLMALTRTSRNGPKPSSMRSAVAACGFRSAPCPHSAHLQRHRQAMPAGSGFSCTLWRTLAGH